MLTQSKKPIFKPYRFSVAPMMDCTDKHFRILMRQITNKSLLYTEMVVAQALYHSKNIKHLLDFNEIEHPIALQVGGDDPKLLKQAAKLAHEWGYDEINLNVGCPSQKVQKGNFGACLMANPHQVGRCIEAMAEESNLPVTVKNRIGIDHLDSEEFLLEFIDVVAKAGAKRFAIHARKAWLKGLDPKQNRTIPPLQYDRVEKIKQLRPHLKIELNGGIQTTSDCKEALKIFDGVMVGRAAYEHPMRWKNIDEIIFSEEPRNTKASEVIRNLIPYANYHLANNGKLWDICRHMQKLVEEVPGSRLWRKNLGLKAQTKDADITIIEEAAQQLEEAGL